MNLLRVLRMQLCGWVIVSAVSVSLCQELHPKNPAALLYPCCDDGAATATPCNGYTAHFDPTRSCVEYPVTGYICVDHTRDELLCQGWYTGTPYCRENPPNEYPRYYAVLKPIGVSPSSLTFTAQQGGSNPSAQTLTIVNNVYPIVAGDYDLPWLASENLDWLSLSSTSGHAYGATPTSTNVSVNIAGKSPGVYTGSIVFTSSKVSPRQNTYVSVTLTITAPLTIAISGPTFLGVNELGTYTATASGGVAPYHYQWYYYRVCPDGPLVPQPLKPTCGYWYTAGTDSRYWSYSDIYDFKVKCDVVDAQGTVRTSNILYVTVSDAMAKGESRSEENVSVTGFATPSVYSFSEAYPNPFNPATKLVFSLPEAGYARLSVLDMLGREVVVIDEGFREPGGHHQVWDGTNSVGGAVASGVYFARLVVINASGQSAFIKLNKLLLLK